MRDWMEKAIKQLALSMLPNSVLWRLWHIRRRGLPRTALECASDRRVISVQDGVTLDVYWAAIPDPPVEHRRGEYNQLGHNGPCVSLFVLREEVMRLECFGGLDGHMHMNPEQQGLLAGWGSQHYFPDGSRESQVERAAFELIENSQAFLLANQLSRIRDFRIDEERLAEAVAETEAYMNELLAKNGGP
jgi:hypothetical protein